MAEAVPIPILSEPGIKRDGTLLDGKYYTDGAWLRFQRKRPRKIGGYRAINKFVTSIPRSMNAYTRDQLTYVHLGTQEGVYRFYIDGSNNTSVISDRTPVGFVHDDANLWQFDAAIRILGGVPTPLLIGQVAPNLTNIANSEDGALYQGGMFSTDPLASIALPTGASASGGVVFMGPYLMYFGNAGYVGWSIAGNPTDLTGAGSGGLSVTSQKIIRALPLRGGGSNSPAGLFWTLDAVVRGTFVGGAPVFAFDTVAGQSSILSAASVIEYDGVFYWAGVDRFLTYNGVVREVENNLNLNFFFDNLNEDQRQKVFATKVPRFGEIWWCFPKDNATECNHAIIFNVRENTWYDTPLPNGGRSAAVFPTVFNRPLMAGALGTAEPITYRLEEDGASRLEEDETPRITEESDVDHYRIWVHEVGVDEVDGQFMQPIRSFFTTGFTALPVAQGVNKLTSVSLIEPDFVQAGDMTVQISGRANARATETSTEAKTITAVPSDRYEQVVNFKVQFRQLRFTFESNVIGGDYQMGALLAHVAPADGTVLG